jgi:hypothetical protein
MLSEITGSARVPNGHASSGDNVGVPSDRANADGTTCLSNR